MKMFRCLFALVLFVPAMAFAEMGNDKKPMENCPMMQGRGGMADRSSRQMDGMECKEMGQYLKNKKELGLTEDQVKQLESIKTDCMKAQVKREADIKLARIDMMDLMKKESPDFAGMKEKIKQVDALELDGKLAMIDTKEKAYNVLTADQQKKLPELMKEKWEGRKMMKKDKKEEMPKK